MSGLPVIPGYTIISQLGEGGMAKVYLAVQEKLDRKVAIKILDPSLLRHSTFANRFDKEAKTAANLSHSNIITIYDTGRAGDHFYMAMEYLEESLKDRMQFYPDRHMPPEIALDITKDIMTALDYAHIKGIYHRDIKPDNIMFRSDNTTVLVDFGIARIFESKDELTKSGIIMGSVYYLSPEQCRGTGDIDGRCDTYSMGAVLFEMLAGEKPYDGETQISILLKHLQDPPPILPQELARFQPLIELMMAKDKNKRISSLPEFERELDLIISSGIKPANPTEATVVMTEILEAIPTSHPTPPPPAPPPPTPVTLLVPPPPPESPKKLNREFSFLKPTETKKKWSYSEFRQSLKGFWPACVRFFKNAPSHFSDINKDVTVIKKDLEELVWKKPKVRRIVLGVLATVLVAVVLGLVYHHMTSQKNGRIVYGKTSASFHEKPATWLTEQGQLRVKKIQSLSNLISQAELEQKLEQANTYFNEKNYEEAKILLKELKEKKFSLAAVYILESKLQEVEDRQFNSYLENAIDLFKKKSYRKAKEFISKAKAIKITDELRLWEDNIEARLKSVNN